jgi:poly-D-alanine transfer protein DltD
MKIISSMKSKLLIIPLIMVLAMVAILFFAQGQVVSAYAADNTSETGIVTEYSAFGKASIEDDFADDRILVVLNS